VKNLICAVILLAVGTAQADTIYVDANCPGGDGSIGNPYCSIQTAIDNAVAMDEVVVAPGTYVEAINFDGKAVWLRSSDGADVTTIHANGPPGADTAVTCNSAEGPDHQLHVQRELNEWLRRRHGPILQRWRRSDRYFPVGIVYHTDGVPEECLTRKSGSTRREAKRGRHTETALADSSVITVEKRQIVRRVLEQHAHPYRMSAD